MILKSLNFFAQIAPKNSISIRAVVVLSIAVLGIFILFMFVTPCAVKMISSTELIEINNQLQQEIDHRRQAETDKLNAQIKYSNLLKLTSEDFESSDLLFHRDTTDETRSSLLNFSKSNRCAIHRHDFNFLSSKSSQ